jgi:hypothetical protein
VTEEQLDELFRIADEDGSGAIDFGEFVSVRRRRGVTLVVWSGDDDAWWRVRACVCSAAADDPQVSPRRCSIFRVCEAVGGI